MNYLKITFSVLPGDTREVLSALLSQTEMTGIEEAADSLTVYYKENDFPESALKAVAERLSLLYEQESVPETNWNERWEQSFQPVLFDSFCSIRAHFHPRPDKVDHDLIITPKMAFGTGHHATTEMMIRLMREMDFKNKKVLDFGTGTGVLAILAEKLGAKEVVAIDYDQWSVNNALENVTANDCSRIAVLEGSLELVENRTFDLVLANINRTILVEYMSGISALLPTGGTALISGILAEEDLPMLLEQAKTRGLTLRSSITKNNWAAALLQK